MSFAAGASGTQKTPAISPCQKFVGHSDLVRGVIHLLGGQRIMTCSDDGSLRVWNLKTGEQIGDAWRDGENRVLAIALSLDGKKVVCGCADGAVKLWDIDTGKFIAKWAGHTDYVRSVCWNRDCGRVVSASRDGTARVWDVESGKTVLPIDTGLSDLQAVVYSPDMDMIATGGENEDLNEFIKIWDAKTGKLITNLKGHTWSVYCLAWTADGSTLVSGSFDSSIRTWNTTTWQQIHVLTAHDAVYGISISPNGPILASVSWDHTARLWDLENGLPIGSPLQHPGVVQCVSFSTDGKSLATGCWDKNACSWDISGILEEAGLLNAVDVDKSLIEADATRRPAHTRRDVHRIPPRFFDDAPRHPHQSTTHQPSPSRPGFLGLARSTFVPLSRRRNDEGVELQERRLAVVDVPLTAGKPRNYSMGQLRSKEKKERQKAMQAKNAKNAKNAHNKDSTNPSGAAHAQPTSQLHGVVSTLSTAPAVAATSTTMTSRPEAMTPQAGCWIRFGVFIGCVPPQYTDAQ